MEASPFSHGVTKSQMGSALNPGYLLYVGDEIRPSYIGIIS